MDIDAGCGVRKLRDDARQQGHAEQIEFVSEPMMGDGGDARVAKPHLFDALGRGVALVGGQNIVFEQRAHMRQTCGKLARYLG